MPADISVTGYDDSRLARLSQIALTTIGQDTPTITTAAITRAINRLDHAPINDRELVIAPSLIIRKTTAPPPRA